MTNVRNYGTGRRPIGASMITQQVAKNFFTNEVSIDRKIKEAILAFRMERAFTKDQILALYLNEIYLGQGSYGVAQVACSVSTNHSIGRRFEEMAYLAASESAVELSSRAAHQGGDGTARLGAS